MSKNDKTQKPEIKDDLDFDDNEIMDQEVDQENVNKESDEVNERDELAKLQDDLVVEKDRYLRLFAEFENYKKRTSREKMEMFKTAGEGVLSSLLPVLDDFGRALKEIEKTSDDGLFKGVKLIQNKLQETLKSKGLELMEVNAGDSFDAEKHEAITQIAAPEKKLKGKIIDVVESGYSLGDKIIRYPKVVIGQ